MCIFCLNRLCFGVLAATLNNATAISPEHFETSTSWETVEYLTATHTLRLPPSLSCVNTLLDPSLTLTPAMDASLRNAKGLHDELGALQANLLRRFTNLVNLAEVSPFSSQPHLIFSLTLYGPGQTRHSRRFGSHAISNSSRDSSSGVQTSSFLLFPDEAEASSKPFSVWHRGLTSFVFVFLFPFWLDSRRRRCPNHHSPNARDVAVWTAQYAGRE